MIARVDIYDDAKVHLPHGLLVLSSEAYYLLQEPCTIANTDNRMGE